MATETIRLHYCAGMSIKPEAKAKVQGKELTGWVDWLGREQIKGGFGNVYLYVLEYVRSGIAVYSREQLAAMELELVESFLAVPACQ